MTPPLTFVFFGADEFSVSVLEELSAEHLLPALIVCPKDKPKGRNLELTASGVKVWAKRHDIDVLQPEKLDLEFSNKLKAISYKLFIVASYGKIIPKAVLNIPLHGALNVHPSLLPMYRGSSPIQSQILNDEKEVGVSIMLMDEEVDHGSILIQEKIHAAAMPLPAPVLTQTLGSIGGRLLGKIIPAFLSGELKGVPQDHQKATFTKKINKEDGLINLALNHRQNYLKYLAYQGWPNTFFVTERKGKSVRVIIKDAYFANQEFKIKTVLPEGGREMSYEDFLRGS